MARFEMDTKEVERLYNVVKNFPSNAEKSINEVFRNDAPPLVSEEIKRLMPVSAPANMFMVTVSRKPHAKYSDSLRKILGNLSFTVTTKGEFGYLYFPDDGTNTRRHVGNQQFFKHGGENKQTEIVDRCINRIVKDFGQ